MKLKIKLRKNCVPTDYFEKFFGEVGLIYYTKINTFYDKNDDDYFRVFEMYLNGKNIQETLKILNNSIPQSKEFFEKYGKDAFDIEAYENFGYDTFGTFGGIKYTLKINDVKYNLGIIEFIRDEEKDKKY